MPHGIWKLSVHTFQPNCEDSSQRLSTGDYRLDFRMLTDTYDLLKKHIKTRGANGGHIIDGAERIPGQVVKIGPRGLDWYVIFRPEQQ
jgi:hypothetical protein